MKRLFCAIAFGLAALGAAAHAGAQDQSRASSEEVARVHFKKGVELYDRGNHPAALEEFRAAYAAKASPSIKRNIALCLRALRRYPEAVDALEEMLAEGDASLKADVKDAARRAIAEMSPDVASARVRLVFGGSAASKDATVSVDEREIPTAKIGQSIHLAPGEHVFRARAAGFFDGMERVRLVGGQTADVELDLVAVAVNPRGRLAVRTNVQSASIVIDGIGVGSGGWVGELSPGRHRVEASAVGYRPHALEVDVADGQPREVTIDMTSDTRPAPDVPPPYEVTVLPARAARDWFVLGGLSLYGETLTFGPTLGNAAPTRRDVGGGGLVVHGGRSLGKYLSVGLVGELGAMAASPYAADASPSTQIRVNFLTWSLAPELRVRSSGKFRAIGGVALGLQGQFVSAEVPAATSVGTTTVSRKGGGTSGMAMLEGGAQYELGRLVFEATVFLDVHGVGAAGAPDGRFFQDSPAARAGLRALLGYTF